MRRPQADGTPSTADGPGETEGWEGTLVVAAASSGRAHGPERIYDGVGAELVQQRGQEHQFRS